MKEWDPLDDRASTDEIVNAAKKREVRNIIKSYTGLYDSFSELIQNALDAIDKRLESGEEGYKPRVFVEINLKENTIKVIDNGRGFSAAQFAYFLKPNCSFKPHDGKSRGNKGVGATFLGYAFNHLEVGTKSPGFTIYGAIEDGRRWLEDKENQVPRPHFKETESSADMGEIDRGSMFLLRVGGEKVRPSSLQVFNADTAEKWSSILRARTPLGGVYSKGEESKTLCVIRVVNQGGAVSDKEIESCEYLFPHSVVSIAAQLGDILNAQKTLIDQGKNPESDLPARFKNLNGIYEIWDSDQILNKTTSFSPQLSKDEQALLTETKPILYCLFSYSVDIWDAIDEKLGFPKGTRILDGGLRIAASKMIQGPPIAIPLTANIGYQKSCQVLAVFGDIDIDLGRKGFQPEIVELSKSLSASAVNHMKKWKNLLRPDTGEEPDITEELEKHEWIKLQEKHEAENPLTISNKNFFLPMREIGILSKPIKEQDVIVLFNQLVSGGVVRGIRIMATSQHEKYDSVCKVMLTEPLENHIFDREKNPLGLLPERAGKPFSSAPWILEYKYNLNALIEEFEKNEKQERDINLVVCWDSGDRWKSRYSINSLLLEENLHYRTFHGATHDVRSAATGSRVFFLIVLSDLVDYLNKPSECISTQRTKYQS